MVAFWQAFLFILAAIGGLRGWGNCLGMGGGQRGERCDRGILLEPYGGKRAGDGAAGMARTAGCAPWR